MHTIEELLMKFQDYSVDITGGQEVEGGYVEIPHSRRYTLVLGNYKSLRCDARVTIDGKHIGTWRINPEKEIRLERPVEDAGHFTFYRFGSVEAQQAELVLNDQLGLIRVDFTPEQKPEAFSHLFGGEDIPAFRRQRSGGTGLSGHSDQKFQNAVPIVHDEAARVTIHLRLVEAEDRTPRPLRAVSMQTPVPPLQR